MFLLFFALAPGGDVWGANRALLQLLHFRHLVATSYTFDTFLQESNGVTTERAWHAPQEIYQADFSYLVYSSRVLKGTVSLGAQAQQQFGSGDGTEKSSQARLNYGIAGTAFRLKMYPVNFYVGSTLQRITPPFARSYQQKVDQRNVMLSLTNYYLPGSVTLGRTVYETSGQKDDHRDTADSFGGSLGHTTWDNKSNTTAALATNHGTSESLSGAGVRQDNYAVSGSLTNLYQPAPGGPLYRAFNTTYNWSGEDGSHEGKSATLRESIDWQLGQALRAEVEGELAKTSSGTQWREERRGRAGLEHRLLETVTTRIDGDVMEGRMPGGEESTRGVNLKLSYARQLPENSALSLDYAFNERITDSLSTLGSLFYRDERLNAEPVETSNYLARNDILLSTLVVWNATRTKTFVSGVDYTPVGDGRRTRLRIEPTGAITIGDPLSLDYSVAVDQQVKYQTQSHGVSSMLNLWQSYYLYASMSQSSSKKLSGSDDIAALGPESNYSLKAEKVAPNYRAGLMYANLDSVSLKVQKYEGYWRYSEEFEQSALSASVIDILSMYEETITPAGVVTPGGSTNQLRVGGMYRRDLNERLKCSVHGEVSNATGRSTNQQTVAGWLRGTYFAGKLETELNVRMDWRFFKDQYQRNISTRLDLKRYF